MEPQKLPQAAEEIRQEMKALIPHVWLVNEDIHGNKNYGGDAIWDLMCRMKVALKLDEGWQGRLIYRSKPTTLINSGRKGYIIPISDNIQMYYPEGSLKGGSFIQMKNEQFLAAGVTALILIHS
ncbi:hypothetical protein N7454_008164 [Penicillium verhagenii]|nr:hypothetical protein N7454_008164 [Penicillium verhagenii]